MGQECHVLALLPQPSEVFAGDGGPPPGWRLTQSRIGLALSPEFSAFQVLDRGGLRRILRLWGVTAEAAED